MSTVLDMTLTETDKANLTKAATAVKKREEALNSEVAARDYVIRGAAQNGASLREIAEVAGMSHQRVAQIIAAAPAAPFCDELNINYGETCSRKAKWTYEKEGTVRHYCTQHAPKRNRYCKPL